MRTVLAVGSIVTWLALACGGGGNEDAGRAASTPTAALAVASPTGASGTGRTATPATPVATARPPTTVSRIADLSSYRYVVKMEGFGGPLSDLSGGFLTGTPGAGAATTIIELSGAYIRPDRAVQTVKLGSFTVTETTIGRQQWTAVGTLVNGPDTLPAAPAASELSIVVDLWDEGLSESVAMFGCSGRETVSGVATRRCGLDQATFSQIAGFFGGFGGDEFKSISRFALEAWLAEQGNYPVRLRIDMAGKDLLDKDFRFLLSMDLTEINSTSIRIEPPR